MPPLCNMHSVARKHFWASFHTINVVRYNPVERLSLLQCLRNREATIPRLYWLAASESGRVLNVHRSISADVCIVSDRILTPSVAIVPHQAPHWTRGKAKPNSSASVWANLRKSLRVAVRVLDDHSLISDVTHLWQRVPCTSLPDAHEVC